MGDALMRKASQIAPTILPTRREDRVQLRGQKHVKGHEDLKVIWKKLALVPSNQNPAVLTTLKAFLKMMGFDTPMGLA